jgi:hypothetical protein
VHGAAAALEGGGAGDIATADQIAERGWHGTPPKGGGYHGG